MATSAGQHHHAKRIALGHDDRELFLTHPDRAWLLDAAAEWNLSGASDPDSFQWWTTSTSPASGSAHDTTPLELPADTLRRMQLYEASLRLSSATQTMLNQCYQATHSEHPPAAPFPSLDDAIEALQRHVALQAGVAPEHLEAGVLALQQAQSVLGQARGVSPASALPGPDTFTPHYVRFNRVGPSKVAEGQELADVPLLTGDGQQHTSLLRALAQLKAPYRTPFLFIQLAEAHAEDEWPIGSPVQILQHTSAEERAEAAAVLCAAMEWKPLVQDAGVPCAVTLDSMHDDFQTTYGAWPAALMLVGTGDKPTLDFMQAPDSEDFTLDRAVQYLMTRFGYGDASTGELSNALHTVHGTPISAVEGAAEADSQVETQPEP